MKYSLTGVLGLFTTLLSAQTWDWVETIRPGGNEYCWDVTNDPWGNVLATGRVKAYSTFGSGSFAVSPPPHGTAETDVFVAKYRPNGNLVWAQRDGGVQADWGRAVASDAMGNVFVTGDYCDSAYFGSNLIVPVGSVTNRNIFLAKYDSSGVCLWAKTAGNAANYSRGYGVVADQSGNCYITGHISGASNFDGLPFGVNGYNLPFIAKFDPSGVCQWVKSMNCQYGGEGNDIKIDKDGNLLLVGAYRGTVWCGTVSYTGTSSTWEDVFLAKLDQNGNFLWSAVAKGAFQDQANSVDSDSDGNVYLVGSFANDLTFGVTPSTTTIVAVGTGTTATVANKLADVFLAKYSSTGTFQWVKTIGNAVYTPPDPNDVWADDIEVTPSDKILIAGFMFGNVNMAGIPLAFDTVTHNSFVTAFDRDGNVDWYKLRSGPGYNSVIRGLSSDAYSNCYVGGEFSGTPYSPFDSITVMSYSGYDGLIAKLMPPLNPIINADLLTACPGDSIHFNALQDGYPMSYQWTFSGASPGTAGSSAAAALYNTPGSYPVSLVVANGHGIDTTNLTIVINSPPVVYLGADTTLCAGQTLVLDAGSGFSSYVWSDLSTGQTNSVTSTGQYYVTVADAAGCSGTDTTQATFDICTDLNEHDVVSAKLFPNPASAALIVHSASPDEFIFSVADQLGRVVFSKALSGTETALDVSALSPGVYLYYISAEGKVTNTGKLVIAR